MSYFLFNQPIHSGEEVTITGDEARHILLSRRIKTSEHIILQDSKLNRFVVEVMEIKKQSLSVRVLNPIIPPAEPLLHITLCQALIAEQALDIILQKATELGVYQVVLFPSAHSPSHAKNAKQKVERWKKIMLEAAKQCDRITPPQLTLCNHLEDLHTIYSAQDIAILLDSANTEKQVLPKNIKKVSLTIGPEGGLAETERTWIQGQDRSQTLNLGPRVLRAETAAISATAILQSLYGDMGPLSVA